MNDCQFQPSISAYHDGELSAELSRLVEQHLDTCSTCCAMLADLRVMSSGITAEMSLAAGSSAHRAALARLGDVLQRQTAKERAERDLSRTAFLLGALAASILLVSATWLIELRPASDDGVVARSGSVSTAEDSAISPGSDWERIAVTLRADPRPAIAGDSPFAPRYADAIDWMLHNLAPIVNRSEGQPWVKPS